MSHSTQRTNGHPKKPRRHIFQWIRSSNCNPTTAMTKKHAEVQELSKPSQLYGQWETQIANSMPRSNCCCSRWWTQKCHVHSRWLKEMVVWYAWRAWKAAGRAWPEQSSNSYAATNLEAVMLKADRTTARPHKHFLRSTPVGVRSPDDHTTCAVCVHFSQTTFR